MTENTSTNSALTQALADLPPKPRVHELAKRTGLSSKELIAALAERGVAAKAASSSVDRAAAIALLTALIGSADSGTEPVADAAAEPASRAAGKRVAERSATSSAAPGAMALFLEPDPARATTPARTRKARPADDESGSAAVPEIDSGEDAAPVDQPTRSRSRSRRKPAADQDPTLEAEQARPEADAADGTGPAADDGDSPESAGRRRRRRGRRGRGKADDDLAEQSENDDRDDQPTAEKPARRAAKKSNDAAEQSADESDPDNDADADTDADGESGESGDGTRRRRRRRRRSGTGGDENTREDDPDNTVVHVREPRSGEAAGSSASSEVQGIKGSTRLEAKRQRRRDTRDSRRRPQILTEAEFLARRESVDRVMAVRQRGDLAQVALLEDNILVEHFVSRAGSASMIGNIYLGKVQNVLPSMEAAFVDIGRGRNAVLYAGEVNWDSSGLSGKARRIETALSSGDTVLVQVSKDPVGHKGARLTTQISLPGRFLVYVPAGGATGISRKLPDTERKRLKGILDRIVPDDAGVIIRTAAEGVAEDELARDVERLKTQWDEIKAISDGTKKSASASQLSAEPDTLIKVVRDLFNSDINRLIIDGEDTWESVSGYVDQVAPELSERVERFDNGGDASRDVFSAYRIDEQIAKALERKVHLPSGGSLVIDRTEAMTVVDVNTGKYTGSGGNLEETVTKNNLEAAEEIVRQLRLRDIGGIIVVDFIDMVLESNRDLVLRRLTECLGRDRTRHQVAEVTSLGLVQMTRKRMGTGLVEAFSETCDHCHGRGIVLRDIPVDHTPTDSDAGKITTGKKRRERKRTADSEPAEPIARITTLKADPRGPRSPLAAAAATRSGDDQQVGAQAADGLVTDVPPVADEARDAVAAVIEQSGAENDGAENASAENADAEKTDTEKTDTEKTAAPKRSRNRRKAAVRVAPADTDGSDAPVGPSTDAIELPAPAAAIPPSAPDVPAAAPEPAAAAAPEPAAAQPPAAPAPRARRRRAASRPAGPAGSAEPILVTSAADSAGQSAG